MAVPSSGSTQVSPGAFERRLWEAATDDGANIHGTAIAIGPCGVLLRGPSGAGKSDLALRTMALPPGPLVPHQPILVADDQVLVAARGQALWMTAPAPLRGLIEVRGVGIVAVAFALEAELALVVDLVPSEQVERLPEDGETAVVCGCTVPRLRLSAFEPSSPLKLVLGLAQGVAEKARRSVASI